MAELGIDFDVVNSTATNIKNINIDLDSRFQNVRESIIDLYNNWHSASGQRAIEEFNYIESFYRDGRYNVLDSFVNFLIQPVSEGYTETEKSNLRITEQFK